MTKKSLSEASENHPVAPAAISGCQASFPADIPWDCVREFIAAIRSGDLKSWRVVKLAMYIGGCAASMAESITAPPADVGTAEAAESMALPPSAEFSQLAEKLESLDPENANGAAAKAIPPAVWAIVLQLLQWWLSQQGK